MEVDLPGSLIAKLEWRQEIPSSIKDQLLGLLAHERGVEEGQDFSQTVPQSSFCSVLADGFAARYKLMPNGRRQITALYVPGDFVDLAGFLLKSPDYDVMALTRCRVALADHEHLRMAISESPIITELLWMDSLVEAAIQQEWLVAMGRRSALEHLAHLICELFLRLRVVQRTNGLSFRLPLTQTDIADVLGLSMVHVNRILKTLRSEEVMIWANQIVTVVNWNRLRQIAQFDPAYLAYRAEPV